VVPQYIAFDAAVFYFLAPSRSSMCGSGCAPPGPLSALPSTRTALIETDPRQACHKIDLAFHNAMAIDCSARTIFFILQLRFQAANFGGFLLSLLGTAVGEDVSQLEATIKYQRDSQGSR
jgi:hypothetical protein